MKSNTYSLFTYSFFVFIIGALFFLSSFAFAEGETTNVQTYKDSLFGLNNLAGLLGVGGCKDTDTTPEGVKYECPKAEARTVILKIIQLALGFTSLIAFAFVAYGGFLWTTAGGSEERVKSGRQTLAWAAIGLIVIVTAWSIVTYVMSFIGEVV